MNGVDRSDFQFDLPGWEADQLPPPLIVKLNLSPSLLRADGAGRLTARIAQLIAASYIASNAVYASGEAAGLQSCGLAAVLS